MGRGVTVRVDRLTDADVRDERYDAESFWKTPSSEYRYLPRDHRDRGSELTVMKVVRLDATPTTEREHLATYRYDRVPISEDGRRVGDLPVKEFCRVHFEESARTDPAEIADLYSDSRRHATSGERPPDGLIEEIAADLADELEHRAERRAKAVVDGMTLGLLSDLMLVEEIASDLSPDDRKRLDPGPEFQARRKFAVREVDDGRAVDEHTATVRYEYYTVDVDC